MGIESHMMDTVCELLRDLVTADGEQGGQGLFCATFDRVLARKRPLMRIKAYDHHDDGGFKNCGRREGIDVWRSCPGRKGG
jgi:hypothetical protein